jgi:hypothetical protein
MGSKVKITPAQVYIIGAVLTVITAVAIYFALMKPAEEAYAAADQRFQTADATALKMPQAQADRKKAEQEVARAESLWRRYDRQYMPNIDISNLLVAWQQVTRENVNVLQPKLERFLRADRKVQVVTSSLTVPPPPADPNMVNRKAFVYDLGSVSVAGTFNDVLNHVERWNKFDRLVLADNLTLAGNSPRLLGTYTLRIFELTHGETPGAAIPVAQPANGGFGGGGGPSFGPPTGVPSGSPYGNGGIDTGGDMPGPPM